MKLAAPGRIFIRHVSLRVPVSIRALCQSGVAVLVEGPAVSL